MSAIYNIWKVGLPSSRNGTWSPAGWTWTLYVRSPPDWWANQRAVLLLTQSLRDRSRSYIKLVIYERVERGERVGWRKIRSVELSPQVVALRFVRNEFLDIGPFEDTLINILNDVGIVYEGLSRTIELSDSEEF